jgi:translation machinery-associated protein 16
MAPTEKPKKAAKKEKIFHPESRKAEQLARKQLRKSKLTGQASMRKKLHSAKGKLSEATKPFIHSSFFFFFSTADFYGFFFHAIPEDPGIVLTLPELHELVLDVWLTRHDAELEEERAARRKGRPKSTKEQKLEEIKLREAEEYRTGKGERPPPSFVGPPSFLRLCTLFCSLVDATRKINQRYRT